MVTLTQMQTQTSSVNIALTIGNKSILINMIDPKTQLSLLIVLVPLADGMNGVRLLGGAGLHRFIVGSSNKHLKYG